MKHLAPLGLLLAALFTAPTPAAETLDDFEPYVADPVPEPGTLAALLALVWTATERRRGKPQSRTRRLKSSR